MSKVCCVRGCLSGRDVESTVDFFRFPSDEAKRSLWIAALKTDVPWTPSETDLVCSHHFDPRYDFIVSEDGSLFLEDGSLSLSNEAVPSLQLQGCHENIAVEEVQSQTTTDSEEIQLSETIVVGDVQPFSQEISISTDNITSEENLNGEENDDNDKSDETDTYAYLRKFVKVDQSAPREKLLEQFNRAFNEKISLRKRMKLLKRKNFRAIEKIGKAHQKLSQEAAINSEEKKKKKKLETQTKLRPVNLAEVVTYLETQDLLSTNALCVIKSLLGPSLTEPISHDLRADSTKDKDIEITPIMKTFAKTLLFYSSEAYHMVKELYQLPIPTASITRTWYNMGLGLPGWSSEAFLMLKDEIQKCENTVLNTSVIVGEFDLNAASSYEETEVRGYIDYGTTGDLEAMSYSENLPLAQSALFFMLVPMNAKMKWRIPLAFFLIDTLSPEERANILLECLWRVYNMGSVAVAVVLDASVNSRRTVESLGICFEDLPFPCTSFPHPADGLLDVFVVFDSFHILDLLRHTWASVALMVDERGGAISWKYFTELVKVQETQAGSSEQSDPIATWYWDKSLMRKRLISQLFNDDVANAIECCCNTLLLPQFAGSESTVFFIRIINKIIEILNPGLASWKSIYMQWKKSIIEALNYLFVLRDRTGQGIFATNCKAPFVCLYMNLISVMELCKKIPPHTIAELNLNGLDLLFINIRSRLNWEDCPPVSKFTNTYSLILQEEGVAFTENFVKVDSYWWLDSKDVANSRKSGLAILKPVIKPENTPPVPQFLTFYPVLLQNELQRFRASQLVLVHTVKRVADILRCNSCIEGLQMTYVQDNPTLVLLRKTCGGFVYPSQGVVEVCSLADHHLKIEMRTASFDVKHDLFSRRDSVLLQSVYLAVMTSILDRNRNPFPQLDNHRRENPPGSDHICRLIQVVTASYVLLRLQSSRAWSYSQSL